ncbi:MAG: tRNA 2-thiouridine(34) synthase MnmA [Chloroflexota bacterium]
MSKGRVVVAMSGGVDSAVAAALLKEAGYEVIGVTMRLWTLETPGIPTAHRRCCSVEAIDDARRVCQILDIPYYILNFEEEFQSHVVDYFCQEYARGRTPNPCIACNRHVKFNFLLEKALALGADYLATGHYARIVEDDGKYRLLRAVDSSKDQSYVLYTLGQRELRHLVFPLGPLRKEDTRRKAAVLNLSVADKVESQDICFITEGNYHVFLAERIASSPGELVDLAGRVMGRHRGVAFYTVGQRHGLGLASREPLYVVAIDPADNRLVVGGREELLRDRLMAGDVSFVSGEAPATPLGVTAKIRYKSPEARATLVCVNSRVEVRFAEPQWAITPGQAVVFYLGEEVLGGGTIEWC